MVSQWYDLQLEIRETRVRALPWASIGHVTTRSTSPQHLRSPMLTFATKKLSTGANEQKEDAASFFGPRSFDPAVMVQPLSTGDRREGRKPFRIISEGPSLYALTTSARLDQCLYGTASARDGGSGVLSAPPAASDHPRRQPGP